MHCTLVRLTQQSGVDLFRSDIRETSMRSTTNMETKLQQRLEELKREYATGQEVMVELDKKQTALHDTLMRISGAVQVLEELLQEESGRGGESAVADSDSGHSSPQSSVRIAEAR